MMSMLSKTYATILTLFVVATCTLQADESIWNMQNDASVMGSYGYGYQDNYASYGAQEHQDLFFLRGELLYWKPQVSGLELYFGTGAVDNATGISDEFDTDPHFQWNPGYRIAIGYRVPCSQLEFDVIWTDFKGRGDKNIGPDNFGRWDVKLQQFDILLAYNMSHCSYTVQPFFGLRGTRIHQHLVSTVLTSVVNFEGIAGTDTRTFDDAQTFNGLGPVFGVNGEWNVGKGFGLYGQAGTSVIYGTHKVTRDDTELFDVTGPELFLSTDRKHIDGFDCTLDLAFGIQWKTCFLHITELCLKLGVEHHGYYNQGRLGTSNEDMSFDGGVFSVSIDL